jgi:zinc protease
MTSTVAQVAHYTDHPLEITSAASLGPRQVIKVRLRNGMQVILYQDLRRSVFAWHTWIEVGSRHEYPGKTGMAHLFEHLMFRGTERFPEGEYDRLLECRGAQSNAATWLDWTHYHAALPSSQQNVNLIAALEADRLINLRTGIDVLETERDVVLNERQYRVDDDPDGAITEHLWSLALPNHPYGSPTIGWHDDIASINADDCNAFRARWYTPDRVVLAIVGGFDLEQTLEAIVREYDNFVGASPSDTPEASDQFQSIRSELELEVTTPRLALAYPSPAANSPELLPLEIALDILFGGDSSRAIQHLIHDKNLAISLDGWVAPLKLPGLCELSLSGREGVALSSLESEIRSVIRNFLRDGPTEAELHKSRRQLEIELYRGQMTVDGLASRFGHDAIVFDDHLRFKTMPEQVNALTRSDVLEAAQHAFSCEPASVGVNAR